MGFIPDQIVWSPRKESAARAAEGKCLFCAERPIELFQLPTFGLARPDEATQLVCADCYQQVTFTTPRPAARVVFATPF